MLYYNERHFCAIKCGCRWYLKKKKSFYSTRDLASNDLLSFINQDGILGANYNLGHLFRLYVAIPKAGVNNIEFRDGPNVLIEMKCPT